MRKHNASVSDSELNQVGGTRTRKRQSADEHGHSSGYQDIYNILIDVAELVK